MITLQIVGTDITYDLPDDRESESEVIDRICTWPSDTEILIVDTDEVVTRDVLFNDR